MDKSIETTITKKERNTNLELFRIIAMLLIVAHHYVVNSGVMDLIYVDLMSARSIFLLLLGAWGKTGINCFVLITGYFMCKSSITAKKFAKLLFEVMLYRIVINAIFWISGYGTFSLIGMVKALFPFNSVGTGFTPAFLLFFLLIPFLNILVRSMSKKQHVYLLFLLSFVYIILGTLKIVFPVTMNYFSWFSVLYIFAAYVRLYPNNFFESAKAWGWLALASVVISALSVVACAFISARLDKTLVYYFVTDSNTFLAFATGFSSFMFFKNVKIRYSPFLNAVAASCFGVLLIHSNNENMRRWLWQDVLNVRGAFYESFMPFHAILSVLAIFIVCVIIDRLRIAFLERPLFKFWDAHWGKVEAKFHALEAKLFSKNNELDD